MLARIVQLYISLGAITCASLPAQPMRPGNVNALPASKPTLTEKYGKEMLQFGELRVPEGAGPFPIAIIIHGGCWTKGYATSRMMAPIASELTKFNLATWNIEYRQVGDTGGGWPGTFLDWGAAADYMRVLARSHPLDLSRIVTIGHSAGGHAAVWLAARQRLPADSPLHVVNPLRIHAAVNIDGPCDLIGFARIDAQICGKPVLAPLMGGTPLEQPERYGQSSPASMLPIGVPQFLVASSVLTPVMAEDYRKLAQASGDRVEVLALKTGHFEVIAPGHNIWREVEKLIVHHAFQKAPLAE
jgi:acetyl esterase/lipase